MVALVVLVTRSWCGRHPVLPHGVLGSRMPPWIVKYCCGWWSSLHVQEGRHLTSVLERPGSASLGDNIKFVTKHCK